MRAERRALLPGTQCGIVLHRAMLKGRHVAIRRQPGPKRRRKPLQVDLDEWLREYKEERTHSGKYCYGKTPMQTFKDSIQLAKEKRLDET